MARRYSLARIKIHRNYEIDEAAELLGVTPQTVRTWIKQGLPAITDKRPYLLLGWQLKAFLKEREGSRRTPVPKGEFFCCRCKASRKAVPGTIERVELPDGRPMLVGKCEVCGCRCQRFLRRGQA
jgi:excisionase family DNA binding protein